MGIFIENPGARERNQYIYMNDLKETTEWCHWDKLPLSGSVVDIT